ncbi:hypothetical protein [Leisingera sp. JC1]|uniref:hypothetical protein n=1 Tax=Leisingera sp. JC1 TaxID=1855282 RepID=UPI001130A0EE|nr:hypothetical protein [Leisingera sp. JC1]
MATVNQMRAGLARLFGCSEMRLKALSQSLAATGLRTEGGAGRGAAQMNGRDVGLHAVALGYDLATKDAAEVLAPIDAMPLQEGLWLHRNTVRWTFERGMLGNSKLLTALSKAYKGPATDLPVPYDFGEFIGMWVDGIFEPQLGTYLDGRAELTIHRTGPKAHFRFERQGDLMELTYAAADCKAAEKPKWDQLLVIREELFQELATIVR